MERLTKLQLDNNIIVKIQGLDNLVNLKWLDLSFNLIEKIEGLDKCTELTDLSLFKNNIKVLDGLDYLVKLNVLSIGSNQLSDLEKTITYLRGLKNNLQVLRIDNNLFHKTRQSEYKKFTISRLKSLKYIDYELIEAKEREAAIEENKDEISQQEQAEGNEANDEQNVILMMELRDAKIEISQDIF